MATGRWTFLRPGTRPVASDGLGDAGSTTACAVCHSVVPALVFCGQCGADLDAATSRWQVLSRPNAFAAARREVVYLPRLGSTLFPRVSAVAVKPYRIALFALLVGMAVMSALQWNVAASTVAVLGIPVLFIIYAWDSGAFREDRLALITSLALGVLTGLAWWRFAGVMISHKYGVTNAAAQAMQNSLVGLGLAVTLIGAVLMVLPLPFIRLLPASRRGEADALDGYVIGAAGALAQMTASYLVWWIPQIVAGLVNARVTSGIRMLQDTITYGVVDPLTTIALGGMVGVCLWFRPDTGGPGHRRARPALILCAVLTALLYAGVWIVDAQEWDRFAELGVNLVLTGLAVLALRFGLQIALLHEKRYSATDEPVLCMRCEYVVPDMAFCPVCGASARGPSRGARRRSRHVQPIQVGTPDTD